MHWLVGLLGLLGAGKMLVEGIRASSQDKAMRDSAQQIQRLGAWARVLVEIGIWPRSPAMNALFLGYGAAWLGICGAFVSGQAWAWWAMLAAAVCSLWYLGVGTLISLLLIVLLLFAGR